jgi:hypothetical protein
MSGRAAERKCVGDWGGGGGGREGR